MNQIRVLWLASFNKNKLREIKQILGISVKSAEETKNYKGFEESGNSFKENALIKAKSLFDHLDTPSWVLGEDSGLEVFDLENAPGIFSARYSGKNSTDEKNNAKLLSEIKKRKLNNPKAQFVCHLCLISPDRKAHHFTGILKGCISEALRGQNGFGYDPLFIPEGFETTLGEMDSSEKNEISHRKKALEKLREFFE